MSKYLRLFNRHTDYETFINGGGVELPNVSHCIDANDVHYNKEQRFIAKFNVTSTDTPTKLIYNATSLAKISKIEIDGVILDPIAQTYTFDTVGEHTVKYTLVDPSEIGSSLFRGCESITEVRIPKNIESIGNSAFYGCTNLTKIKIPNSVESIGTNVFTNCTSLPVENNIRYADTCLIEAVDKTLTTYTIKQGTKIIYENAFQNCTNLTSITIPSSVKNIYNYAFDGCSSLTSINIPNNLTLINPFVFQNCTNLTSITIPNGVTNIDNSAFYNCTNLSDINIPNTVTRIGSWTFYNTPWWTEYSSNVNNQYGNIVYINNIAVKAVSTTITSCELKQETVSITRRCFENCNSINSITSLAAKAPTIENDTFIAINTGGTLYVPQGSTGYDTWMGTGNYYLGKYSWTKVEQ